MPMAGEGSRFLRQGWTTPKPLILLHGEPLFIHAIHSVAAPDIPIKHSFIVRQEHIDSYHIDQSILTLLPQAHIYSVLQTTRGAVETCLIAEPAIDDNDAVIVMDCDLEFRSREFDRIIREALSLPADQAQGGALVSFQSSNPRYSYAELNADGLVARTAEKEVISSHALCGAYFFASARRFKQIAHRLLNEPVFTKPEYYVSLLFNYLLQDGEQVRLAPMEEYYSYGTPEELQQYL